MHTQALIPSITGAKSHAVVVPAADQFGVLTGYAGLVATEFSYRKDEEIYGEDEPAEYVYQVIQGAVRTYKLLSDGRRQIGAFHLPGDVFGLESSVAHRLAAEAIEDTTVRPAISATRKITCCCSGARARWNGWRISFWRWIVGLPSPA
jgi:CRP/FNR family nitrogen fixation transcriptional regulator